MPVNPEKLTLFILAYEPNLTRAVQKYPKEYPWPVANVPAVVGKMAVAVQQGTFNKDGYAMKWTCKELGIPYTYKGISEFLEREA